MSKIFGLFLFLLICSECLGYKTYVCVSNDNEEAISMIVKESNNTRVLIPKITEGFEEQVDTMSNINLMSSEVFGNRSFILDRRWEKLPIIKNEEFTISGKTIGFSVLLVKMEAKLKIKYSKSVSNLIFNIGDTKNLTNCTKTNNNYIFKISKTDWIHFQIFNNSSTLTISYKNFECNIMGKFENTTFKVDDNLWKKHNYSMKIISTEKDLEINGTKHGYLNFFAASNKNGTTIYNIFDKINTTETIGTNWKSLNFTYTGNMSFGVSNKKNNTNLEVYVSDLTLSNTAITRIVNYTSKDEEEVKCNFIQHENLKTSDNKHNCGIDELKYCPNENCEICCKGICYNLKRRTVAKFILLHVLIAGILLLLSVCISGVIYWKFCCKKTKKAEKPPVKPTYQEFNQNLVEMSEIPPNRNRNNSENDPLYSSLSEKPEVPNRKRMNSENDPLYSSLSEKREVVNDLYQSSQDIQNPEKNIEEDIFGYIGGKKIVNSECPVQSTAFNNQQPKNEIYFSRAKLNTDTIIENDIYGSWQNNLNLTNPMKKLDYKKNITFDGEKKNQKFK